MLKVSSREYRLLGTPLLLPLAMFWKIMGLSFDL